MHELRAKLNGSPGRFQMPGTLRRSSPQQRVWPRARRTTIFGWGALITLLCLAIVWPSPAHAAAAQVCQVGPGETIQQHLDDNTCTTIEIPAGTHSENLTINRSVILQGAGIMDTKIDGENDGRVITIDGISGSLTVHLRDLRVTGGNASLDTPQVLIHRIGGGILVDNGAALYIQNVRVDNNIAFTGPTRGGFGGGIGLYRGATLHAYDLYLEDNIASGGPGTGFGGGLAVVDASAYLTRTTVYQNRGNYREGALSGDGTGGGLYVAGETGSGQAVLSLWDSEVRNNIAAAAQGGGDGIGGGLRVGASEDTRIYIANTLFEGNRAAGENASSDSGDGGGIAVTTGGNDAQVTIEHSVIQGNYANARMDIPSGPNHARGGGLYADPGSNDGNIYITLIHTDLIENIAKAGTGVGAGQGGGLYARRASITVQGGLIQGNIAARNNAASGQGGGIRMSGVGTTPLIVDSVQILDNVAQIGAGGSFPDETGQGGGIQVSGSGAVITVTNTILGDNRAASGSGGTGAGIYVGGASGASGTIIHTAIAAAESTPAQGIFHQGSGLEIINTIVANYNTGIHNQGATGSVEARYVLISGYLSTNDTVGSVIGTPQDNLGDPLFVNPALRDYHIQAGSDARDAGTNAGINVDIDGDMRPQGPGFDIGADEYTQIAPASVTINGPASVVAGQSYTYTAQVSPPNAQTPLTYAWSPDDYRVTPANENPAVYSWPITGTYPISVTVSNSAGSAMASRMITVASMPISVTAVTIDGPSMGSVNQVYQFAAQVSPLDASAPLTYTWSPLPAIGCGTGQVDINTASVDDLMMIIHIDAVRSQEMLTLRPFSSIDDMIRITGIGEVRIGEIKDQGLACLTTGPGQGPDFAGYFWDTTGVKTIMVTVQNVGGTVTATHPITLALIGVADVSINGPSSGAPDQLYTYQATVSPANATGPVNYTWTTEGLVSGQGTSQAAYNWDTTGTKTVGVTAVNAGGSATTSQNVLIELTGVSGVSIDGPGNVLVDEPNSYTAQVSPANATQPIEYTWSPDPASGQNTSQAAYSWNTPGSRVITVTAQNLNGGATAVTTRTITVAAEAVGVSSVSIDGPRYLVIDRLYSFTAQVSPMDATGPLNYIWSPAPSSEVAQMPRQTTEVAQTSEQATGQGTAQVQYAFSEPGARTIMLTVENDAGSATISHIVEVSETVVELTGAGIDGPTMGAVDMTYTFTATVSPSDATEPIEYAWSPAPESGQGTRYATYGWDTSGPKVITLTARNHEEESVMAEHTITISAPSADEETIFVPSVTR